MSVAKDELFCRLAMREGLLSKDEAVEVLRRYRSEGKTNEEIGVFSVREGYLEKTVVQRLQGAIERRASGHVAETKRRVPPARTQSASNRPPVGRKASTALRKGSANPTQITAISIAGVVLVVAVVLLILQLRKRSSPPVPSPATSTTSPLSTRPVSANPTPTPTATLELSSDERSKYTDRIQLAITTARQEQIDGRINRGLLHLRRTREEMGGDRLPRDLRQELDQEIKDFETFVRERFDTDLANLKAAQKAGRSPDEIQLLLEDIEQACGKELRQEAEKSLGKAPGDQR